MLEKYFKKVVPWLLGIYSCLIFFYVISCSQYFAINPSRPLQLLLKILRLTLIASTIPVAFTSKRNFGLYALSGVLLVLGYLKLHDFSLIIPLFIFFLLPLIGFKKMILVDFLARLSGYAVVVVIMRLFGSFNVYNPVVLGWKLSLGFSNPNTLGAFSMVLFIEAVVLFKQLPHWFLIATLCALTPLLFMSRSRTGIWGTMIFIILMLLKKLFKLKQKRFIHYVVIAAPLILLLVSVFFALWYKVDAQHAWVRAFDLFTSNRLQLGSYFYHKYGVSLLGHIIDTSKYVLDTGYLHLFITKGIIFAIVFLLYYSIALRDLIVIDEWEMVCALVTFLFVGLSENYFYNPLINPFLLSFGLMLTQFDQEKFDIENKIRVLDAKDK